MKNARRILSVILCAVLVCSVFTISVGAKKKAKSYVKSVSVKSKATITIPADKKTAVKSYKVTVKVSGKASKKFTAKSSKTSVASVKVSGTKVKVTAKKAGTAKITVTSKAKNASGKKLKKTLKITVEKGLIPASLDEYYYDTHLSYSDYAEGADMWGGHTAVEEMIIDANSKAKYYAATADASVAKTLDGGKVIASSKAGSTKADIFENLNGKVRKLGTIKISVNRIDMAQAAENVLLDYKDIDFSNLWIKANLGKTELNLKNLYKKVFSEKTKFAESDYSFSFIPDDEKVASVNKDGVITGVKNGSTNIETGIEFSDGSKDEERPFVNVSGFAIEKVDGYSIDNIREFVVGLDTPVELIDGTTTPMINFDNAATTPALKAVKDAIDKELEMYGSIGRGFSQKSNHSTDVYNSVRDKVLDFLEADPEQYTCFYTNSTTDGLNKLASALITSKNDVVLTTRIEHHANDLSWRERVNKVLYAEVDEKGRVIYDDIEKLLKANKVKIVSVSAASNVTGYVNDVHRVAKLAHKYGAQIVVDGAQIVAHRKFSMVGDLNDSTDDIDYIAFSAHKMYSPYGGGAVVGITKELNKHMPTFYGGGTIKVVGDDWAAYKKAPAAYEAGSPNYPGVVGLGKAIDVLSTVGMDKIEAHEKVLNRKIIDGLKKLPNVILYGDTENIDDRVGVVTFNFSDINTYYISQKLSELGGVATRRGAFCAHPYVWRLMGISDDKVKSFENCTDVNTAGMVRVSFGIYNNEEDVDKFLELMPKVMKEAMEVQKVSPAEPAY
ncbi:MAG: aminotransferase class V-fold PLP-dependent enzyme [Ruminococcus sp.]|nr:aminotransferase class V-fold PLP-dependent enzyme [Ruminococcus sp.]